MRYAFRARDAVGRTVRGQLTADMAEEVVQELGRRGLFAVAVRPARPGLGRLLVAGAWTRARPGLRQTAILCRRLGAAVAAGIPVLDALRAAASEEESGAAAAMARRVASRVEAGMSLSLAFAPEADRLPPTFLPFVRAAEASGALDEVLARLADDYERQEAFEGRLRSALAYPAVVVLMAVAVVTFLLLFVVPNFALLYSALHVPLPAVTRILLGVAHVGHADGLEVLLFAAAVAVALALTYRSGAARRWAGSLRRHLPLLGPLAEHGGVARFGRTLGALLRAGVPILEALEVSRPLLASPQAQAVAERAARRVRQGEPLASALSEEDVRPPAFPLLFREMVRAGEETGRLDEMLERAAAFFEADVDRTQARLVAVLEPALVLFLAAAVATIVGSVLVPMYSVFQNTP
ncbi:MAG: type II secretion system F family protein [Firmicutes bacterium]|nr:type II secretion system F family protein [Bacillota bacterium]